jgi:hypothetical protein
LTNGWTIDTLKEHFEKILAEKDKGFYKILEEKDKALSAALIAVKEENRKTEIAAEKRFELLNELRSGVATKDQLLSLEKVVDDLKTSRDKGEGKGQGISQFIGWIIAGITIIGFIISNWKS